MKTKLFDIVLLSVVLSLMAACKNPRIDIESFEITAENIETEAYSVKVTGSYSFTGNIREMKINIDTNELLSNAVDYPINLADNIFSSEIDSLMPNTTYYYNYGIDFGGKEDHLTEVNSFTTLQGPPITKTLQAIEIDAVSYQIKCEVFTDGGASITERGICWNTSGTPNLNDNTEIHHDNAVGEYDCQMNHLEPNKRYYVRAYAKNAKGVGLGNVVVIQTGNVSNPPVVTTAEIVDITSNSATCGGTVISEGGSFVDSCGVCWSTEPNPTIQGEHSVDGSGLGDFVSHLTDLTPNKTYYVRAYAKNSTDTSYGEQKTFITTEGLPEVITGSVFDITPTTAKCSGEVVDSGASSVTERGICWSTSHNPTINESQESSGGGTGIFTCQMTGLSPNSTYYVRAYATNSHGTSYGNEVSFEAQDGLPKVNIGGVFDITSTTAKCDGNVIDEGASAVINRGVCWSTNHNPTISGSHVSGGVGIGTFTCQMNHLSPDSTYYVRAYAKNSQGISYSSVEVFFNTSQTSTYTISVSANPSNGGTVAGGGTYQQGQSCTVVASPNPNYIFTGWKENGNVVSTNANYTFTVSGNRTLVANFTYNVPTTYTVNVSANPANGGNVTGGGTYQQGQSCTVVASPNPNYIFTSWTENGNVVSTNANYIFTVSGNRILVANFMLQYQVPVGAINGIFSVSDTQKVYFSRGNLRYQASTNTWRFADNQYDYVGAFNNNISSSYNGWIDLFGWGTSGWNCDNTCFHPWDSISNSGLYGPPGDYDLTGIYAKSDWGVNNAINNGGNQANQWRTLTGGNDGEWYYLFNTRNTLSGIRYAKAQVAGVNGIILVPDDWSTSTFILYNPDDSGIPFDRNTINASQWTTLEEAGAVFLPAAGYRNGPRFDGAGSYGHYWSTSYRNWDEAYYLYFHNSNILVDESFYYRHYGFSVRLVQSAE